MGDHVGKFEVEKSLERISLENLMRDMPVIIFITREDDGRIIRWCTTYDLKMFRDFMYYILDSNIYPENFYILMAYSVEDTSLYHFCDVAKEYGMRKRTFDEEIENVQLGKWKDVIL